MKNYNQAGAPTEKEKQTKVFDNLLEQLIQELAKLRKRENFNAEKIADCAKETSLQLGFLGITGFMYGCTVSMLSKCWKHGEALRLWHNLDSQIGTEGEKANESGGVLNPALLNIG